MNPVGPIVFGIAVAGGCFVAAVIQTVHFPDEVFIHQIVGVKNKESLVAGIVMISMDLSEQFVQRISLAHQGFVLPFVDDGPSLTGNGRCVISAVVRYNKNVQKFLGIVLSPQAADQLTDHSAFVACGN